ncbi:MAG: GH25 family lysozyme [Bacteroidales bacterium]|nr:GH25 family lysozyme [Bacteroidales bacterium]
MFNDKHATTKRLLVFMLLTYLWCSTNLSARDICPGYQGIDFSDYTGKVNWTEVAKDTNIQFVYLLATIGSDSINSAYQTYLSGARKTRLKAGAYHCMTSTATIDEQFQNFISHVPKDSIKLVPMLYVSECEYWTAEEVADSVKYFCDLLEAHYGKKPVIYALNAIYNRYLTPVFNDYALYIIKYSDVRPVIHGGNDGIRMLWQYTNKGKIRGIEKPVNLVKLWTARMLELNMIVPKKIVVNHRPPTKRR